MNEAVPQLSSECVSLLAEIQIKKQRGQLNMMQMKKVIDGINDITGFSQHEMQELMHAIGLPASLCEH